MIRFIGSVVAPDQFDRDERKLSLETEDGATLGSLGGGTELRPQIISASSSGEASWCVRISSFDN